MKMKSLFVMTIALSLILPITRLNAQEPDEQQSPQQQDDVKTYTTPDGKTVTVTVKGNRTITVTAEEGKTTTVETVNGKTVRTSTTTTTTKYSDKQADEEKRNEEDEAIISAKVGYGVNKWNISPLSRKMKGDKSSYDYTSEAFYTKRFDLELRLFFIKGGLEYLTNNIREWGGFNRNDAQMQSESKDSKMRQLDIFGGLKLWDTTIKTEILLRQFENTLISRGYRDYSGFIHNVYYYNKSGDPQIMPKGTQLQWNSLYQQYDVKMVTRHNKFFTSELGIQYVIYDAPTEYTANFKISSYNTASVPMLIHTTLYSYNFVFGIRIKNYFNNYVYLQTFIPATIGISRFSNPLFKTQYGYSIASSANISINFATGFTHLEAGVEGRFVTLYAFSMSESSTKKDMEVLSYNGTPATIPKGTKLTYFSMRDDLFYGAFVKAGVFF